MIETNYFILPLNIYTECSIDAQQLGVNLDYFLLEWCEVEGDDVVECDT